MSNKLTGALCLDKKRIIRVFIFIAVGIGTLVYKHVKKVEANEFMQHSVQFQLFDIKGVETKLIHYGLSGELVNLKINSTGLPDTSTSYKTALLSFVCSNKLLMKHLNNGKTVNLNMQALDRNAGKYVNLQIQKERCSESS